MPKTITANNTMEAYRIQLKQIIMAAISRDPALLKKWSAENPSPPQAAGSTGNARVSTEECTHLKLFLMRQDGGFEQLAREAWTDIDSAKNLLKL
jgi:hypothetical protein